MHIQTSRQITAASTSTPPVKDDNEAFTQTDWEFALDIEPNPTIEFLKQHLAAVPTAEAQGTTAMWLSNHILTLEH